jgi:hypothetical protein
MSEEYSGEPEPNRDCWRREGGSGSFFTSRGSDFSGKPSKESRDGMGLTMDMVPKEEELFLIGERRV